MHAHTACRACSPPPAPTPPRAIGPRAYDASPLAPALARLELSAAALAAGRRPPGDAWQEIADDLMAAAQAADERARSEERLGVAAQRHMADVFMRHLADLRAARRPGGGGGGGWEQAAAQR